jgi:hypothetical protein
MSKVRFRNLTAKQKSLICNGCGGKGSWIPIPEFIFGADCNHHDFNYWLGCTKAQRKKADRQFLVEMLIDSIRLFIKEPLYKVLFYVFWAIVYYAAVRLRGYKYFNFVKRKTLEDLEMETLQ